MAWHWEECREGGFIAIGWDKLGDLSGMEIEDFNERRFSKHLKFTRAETDQVWKFAKEIKKGDRIVVNRGTTEMLGIGTVIGSYYFVADERQGHRIPVRWDDTVPHRIEEYGWKRTLIEIGREKFKTVSNAPPIKEILAEPFSSIFFGWEEADIAFDFIRDTAAEEKLPSLGICLQQDMSALEVYLGNLLVVQFHRSAVGACEVLVVFSKGTTTDQIAHFKRPHADSGLCEYLLPISMLQGIKEEFRNSCSMLAMLPTVKGAMKHPQHLPVLSYALTDTEKRHRLFRQGLKIEKELPQIGVNRETLSRWVRAIERKGQAIIYGPPGTGKTYLARGLAKYFTEGGDGFFELLQFHPAYSYEDFIQGIRPVINSEGKLSYVLAPGALLQFCEKARQRTGKCVLIVDEINRANISRVFGELMYVLEYREESVSLASGNPFSFPRNVILIATMNTADRSIAMVDYALRRRFEFLSLPPNYELLVRFHEDTGFPVENLLSALRDLNRAIGDPHYEVGTSYFLLPGLGFLIEDIWLMEIEPYLDEYFRDQPHKVDDFRWEKIEKKIFA